jgi:hypothetical protein
MMLVGQGKIRTREIGLVTQGLRYIKRKDKGANMEFYGFALSNKFYMSSSVE